MTVSNTRYIATAVCIEKFVARYDDEINLSVNDEINIISFNEGDDMWSGRNLTTNEVGKFSKYCAITY